MGLSGKSAGKRICLQCRRPGLIPGSGRFAREEISYPPQYSWASLVAQLVMNMTEIRETWVQSLGWEYQKTSMDCIVHENMKNQT